MLTCELTEANTTGFEIYCDMDGVLVDFNNGVTKVMNDPEFDVLQKKHRANFWKLLNEIPEQEAIDIWANFEWVPGGKELWRYVSRFNPGILSSPGNIARDRVEKGKMLWIKKNLNPKPSKILFSVNKWKHAHQFGILIDDHDKHLIPWEEKGGVAIRYKTGDYKSAIQELQGRFGFPK